MLGEPFCQMNSWGYNFALMKLGVAKLRKD